MHFMLPIFVVAKLHQGTILGPVKPKKLFRFCPKLDQMISIPYGVCSQIDLHRKTNRNCPACSTKKFRLGKLGSFVGLSVEINKAAKFKLLFLYGI